MDFGLNPIPGFAEYHLGTATGDTSRPDQAYRPVCDEDSESWFDKEGMEWARREPHRVFHH